MYTSHKCIKFTRPDIHNLVQLNDVGCLMLGDLIRSWLQRRRFLTVSAIEPLSKKHLQAMGTLSKALREMNRGESIWPGVQKKLPKKFSAPVPVGVSCGALWSKKLWFSPGTLGRSVPAMEVLAKEALGRIWRFRTNDLIKAFWRWNSERMWNIWHVGWEQCTSEKWPVQLLFGFAALGLRQEIRFNHWSLQ